MKEWKRQFMSMERCALLQREAAAARKRPDDDDDDMLPTGGAGVALQGLPRLARGRGSD